MYLKHKIIMPVEL